MRVHRNGSLIFTDEDTEAYEADVAAGDKRWADRIIAQAAHWAKRGDPNVPEVDRCTRSEFAPCPNPRGPGRLTGIEGVTLLNTVVGAANRLAPGALS